MRVHAFRLVPAAFVAVLLASPPLTLAQDDSGRARPPASSGGTSEPRTAVPRAAPAPPAPPATAAPRSTAPAEGTAGEPAAQPRSGGARQRPEAPPRAAVPRGTTPRPPVVVAPRTVIVGYPRGAYPYGYGGFGLGYFYYDPYAWYGPGPVVRYGYPTGEVRLRVQPREAEVFVDGYFVGIVDDFDGVFQGLRLEEGPYTIEIAAPGYEPLEIKLRIQPGRRMTYRGELTPLP